MPYRAATHRKLKKRQRAAWRSFPNSTSGEQCEHRSGRQRRRNRDLRCCIVNIGSAAGLVGVRKRFAYCATKGAVMAMTRQLAADYPPQLMVFLHAAFDAMAPAQTQFTRSAVFVFHEAECVN